MAQLLTTLFDAYELYTFDSMEKHGIPLSKARSKVMDTYYSLLPLNRSLKIFALSCVFRNGRKIQSYWSLTKNLVIVILFTAINSVVLYYKTRHLWFTIEKKTFKFTDTLHLTFIISSCLYFVDLTVVRVFGTDACVKYYNTYENLDSILGMTYYSIIRKRVIKISVFLLLITIISCISDYVAWYVALTWEIPTYYLIEYTYFVIKTLTVLDAISNVLHVEYRQRTLGDAIQEFDVTATNSKAGKESTKTWFGVIKVKRNITGSVKTVSDNNFDLTCLSQYYLMVMEQMEFVNKMFGIRILLICATMLFDMINLLNLAIRVTFQSLIIGNKFPALSSLIRLLSCISILFTLVHSSERSYRQSERIVCIIDDLLVYRKTSAEVADVLKDLRALIITRPVKFHAANFFRINYSLFVSMVSVVVTYTIIFLQSMT